MAQEAPASLSPQEGAALVRLARQEIMRQMGLRVDQPVSAAELAPPALHQQRGVFVTLHQGGNLRGCIGSLAGVEPIVDGIRRHAGNAAFHDPRFRPVTAGELATLHVEISVLTEPQPLTYTDASELLRLLRPGVDGVILSDSRGASATFLPQVWQQLPTPEQFLGHLCHKAGLPETSWRSGQLRIATYQVQYFEEPRTQEPRS